MYNHLRKWKVRWIHISKLKDLSGAQWDEETQSIILEAEHLKGHIKVDHLCNILHIHPFGLAWLSNIVFSSVGSPQRRRVPEQAHPELLPDADHLLLRSRKFAMGSSEPLGTHVCEYVDLGSQEFENIHVHGGDKNNDPSSKQLERE